jgi:hypothetical protein
MTTVSYPSELHPAPPPVSIDIPDSWETMSVPGVAIAAVQAERNADFTPNLIVRVGTRPALDQPADVLMEVAGAMQDRPDAHLGPAEQVELGGVQWTRVSVAWTDAQGLPIRQTHLSHGLPRDSEVQDFFHLTGSTGGASAESDAAVVQGVLESVRITR